VPAHAEIKSAANGISRFIALFPEASHVVLNVLLLRKRVRG